MCAASVVHTFFIFEVLMKKHVALWNEKTVYSFIKEYQKSIPAEYKISCGVEHGSAKRILAAFCKTSPKRRFIYKFKKLSPKDLFFIDLYNFLFVPMPKAIIRDLNLNTGQIDVTEDDRGKTIIIYQQTASFYQN